MYHMKVAAVCQMFTNIISHTRASNLMLNYACQLFTTYAILYTL